MRGALGFLGILIVLGIGYFVYTAQLRSGPETESLPRQSSLIGVRQDLLSMGQAEKRYWAMNGGYTTLDQLKDSGNLVFVPDGRRHGYAYSVEASEADHFRITARPLDPGSDLPILSIDESMQVSP